MSFVVPKWRAHAVRNWDDLLLETADGRTQLNAATAALLNYMPALGITKLEPANVDDAWRRIAIHQALFGTFLHGNGNRPLFLTRSDVERHIGIETEGNESSFDEFCRSIATREPEADEALLPAFLANGNTTSLRAAGVLSRLKE